MPILRIVSLNIRQGAAQHGLLLTGTLAAYDADVLVLAEVRESTSTMLSRLAAHGYEHQVHPKAGLTRTNSLVVTSLHPLRRPASTVDVSEKAACRWLEFGLDAFHFLAIHVPISTKDEKAAFWRAMLDAAKILKDVPAVLIGDLNTGDQDRDREGVRFQGAEAFTALSTELGWRDAYRAANGDGSEYSWYSHADNGFRIDHAFVSPPAADLIASCYYDHRPRTEGLTDHSALVLELRLPACAGPAATLQGRHAR